MTTERDNRPRNELYPNEFNSTIILTEKTQNEDEVEYNPFEHRDMRYAHSTFGSFAHLLKSSLGSGILAMPMGFKNAGLWFGLVGTLAIGFVCAYSVHILVKTSRGICKKTKIPSLSYGQTAETVFEHGPVALRKYSKFAEGFVAYGISCAHLGVCTIYIVFMGTTFHDMANYMLNINYDVRWYIVAVLLPCICIGEVRRLKYLVPFSACGNLFIVITISIAFYYVFTGPLEIKERPAVASWKQFPIFISTVVFAMDGIGTTLPVENSMRSPQHFLGCPSVLTATFTFVAILYAIIGFFGYARYGDNIEGSITMNLPDGAIPAQIAQILIGSTLLFSFGIIFYVPADVLWHKMAPKISKNKHNIAKILLRAGIVLVLGIFAVAVPKLEPFIGLAGAIFVSMLGIFVPAFLETVFLYPNNFGVGNWILYKNVLIMLAALLTLFSGSLVSILEIVDMYSS